MDKKPTQICRLKQRMTMAKRSLHCITRRAELWGGFELNNSGLSKTPTYIM